MVESFSEGETKQILDINGRRELVGKGDGKGRGLVGGDHTCGEQGREKEIRNGSGQSLEHARDLGQGAAPEGLMGATLAEISSSGGTDPEVAIFYNQASLIEVGLGNQPTNKAFNL